MRARSSRLRPSVRPTPPSHHNRASEQSVAVAAVVAASIVWLPFCDWGCSVPRLLARSRFTSDHTRQTEVTGHATLRGASACIDNKGQRPLLHSFLAEPLALFPGAGGTPQPLAGSAGDLNVRRAQCGEVQRDCRCCRCLAQILQQVVRRRVLEIRRRCLSRWLAATMAAVSESEEGFH